MSDQSDGVVERGFPKVQLSFFLGGDQFVFRVDDGEQLEQVAVSVAERSENIVDAITTIKTVAIAKGVNTGGGSQASGNSGGNSSGNRVPDSPPPGGGNGGVPVCDKHSLPMNDLGHKNYKHRYYCSAPRDQQQGCMAKD